ncbi:hypothetical protein ACFE04_001347 [Oxalis oulophora]
MAVQNVLHMIGGDGKNSYAKNSLVQKIVISKTRPILEEAIKNMLRDSMPTCFNVGDLGCSTGPNTLLPISYVIDKIYQICQQKELDKTPNFQMFLNDLIGNDFNSLFNLLPDFYERLEKEYGGVLGSCFILGLPGSSMEGFFFVRVPEGLVNKGNVNFGRTSPPEVFQAYLKQFQKDLHLFLSLRSEEMVSGGQMVLTFTGRSMIDPSNIDCCYVWEMLTKSLLQMIEEGMIEESDMDSFNVPLYTSHEEEVKEIVKMEGSFALEKSESFEIDGHFGDSIVDNLFLKFAKECERELGFG